MNLNKLKDKRKELEDKNKKSSNWKFRNYKTNKWRSNDLSRFGMTREDDSLWSMAFDWGSQ